MERYINQQNFQDDSFYSIVYVCDKKESTKEKIRKLKKINPNFIFISELDADEYTFDSPIFSSRNHELRSKEDWQKWLIKRSDFLWITGEDEFPLEKSFAKINHIPIVDMRYYEYNGIRLR